MRILLIPGFWLTGNSWATVQEILTTYGITADTIGLPGRGAHWPHRRDVGLTDQINAVVEWLDALSEPAVLVGHSAGGNIAYGAADQRPELVRHLMLVDTVPPTNGHIVNDSLPEVEGEIPFPGIDFFTPDDVRDLVGDAAELLLSSVHPESARCAREPLTLTNAARLAIPATLIACEFTADQYWEWSDNDDEIIEDVSVIELPTGHWPQFTKPRELAHFIADTVLTLP